MNLQNFVAQFRAKASPNDRASIDQLASLPEVQAVLDREDGTLQVERQTIVTLIARSPGKYAAALAEGQKACDAAVAAQEAAERAVITAREVLNQKRAALNGLSMGEANEIGEYRKQLLETADGRLAVLIDHLDDLGQMTRHVGWSQPRFEGKDYEGRPIRKADITNWPEVRHARAEIERVRAEAVQFQYSAINRRDLTEKLQAMLLDLEAALAPLEMAVLRIDEAGNVVRQQHGSRQDLVDNVLRKVGAPADAMAQTPANAALKPTKTSRRVIQTLTVNDAPIAETSAAVAANPASSDGVVHLQVWGEGKGWTVQSYRV